MKTYVTYLAVGSLLAFVWLPIGRAEEGARIPGAGSGPGIHESIIEGTLDKYDSTLNKLTIKGIDEDKMTLDAVPSLKAKDGNRRVPMATVKTGQKIRVTYSEKNKKRIAKDVELVKEESDETGSKKEKPGKDEPRIPGAQ
jgi:hypothetical protein